MCYYTLACLYWALFSWVFQNMMTKRDMESFTCKECDKKYYFVDKLKIFIGNNMHKCTCCNKIYPSKDSLLDHMLIHYRKFLFCTKWEFTAKMCESKLSSKPTLRRHQEAQHEGVEYKCDACEFKCADKRYFQKHKKNLHNIIIYRKMTMCK